MLPQSHHHGSSYNSRKKIRPVICTYLQGTHQSQTHKIPALGKPWYHELVSLSLEGELREKGQPQVHPETIRVRQLGFPGGKCHRSARVHVLPGKARWVPRGLRPRGSHTLHRAGPGLSPTHCGFSAAPALDLSVSTPVTMSSDVCQCHQECGPAWEPR